MGSITKILFPLIYPIVSAVMLVLCHRVSGLSIIVWGALVPLIAGLHKKGIGLTLLMSAIFGIAYLHGLFRWVLEVQGYQLYHHFLIAIPFGAYFVCLGLVLYLISSRTNHHLSFCAIPFIWVTIEYVRSNFLFLALPLGLLGHTQHLNRPIIQIANIGGAYMVSFIIVLVNCAVADAIITCVENNQQRIHGQNSILLLLKNMKKLLPITAAAAVACTLLYGHWNEAQNDDGRQIRIALIQGNIEQDKKWNPQYAGMIMDTYASLTRQSADDKPDLIIWPETAMPGRIVKDQKYLLIAKELAVATGSWLLVGSALHHKFEKPQVANTICNNSALLIPPYSGKIVDQHYNKIKLFPFGEYLPHGKFLPWKLLRIDFPNQYHAGESYTIFKHPAFDFAAMICWETLFPNLCREFTKRGAQFIVNISNEARFGKSEAPYLILAANIFRAVENSIYVVRCANTGVSCIIDPFGKIIGRVHNRQGNDIFVQGTLGGTIKAKNDLSIYTRYGDIFAMSCFTATLVLVLYAVRIKPYRKDGFSQH